MSTRQKSSHALTPSESRNDPLTGRWFHMFFPCSTCGKEAVQCQGLVVGPLNGQSFYLVQFISWLDGSLTGKIVTLSDMQRWDFYGDEQEMDERYKFWWAKKHPGCEEGPEEPAR